VSSLAGLLAANLALGVLGCGVLLATGTWDRLRPASRIGPALLAGFALAATALPPLLYAGLSPTPLVAGALAAGALLLGTTLRRRRLRAEPDESGHGLLPAAVLALLLLPLTLRAAVEPLAKFDAYSNWILKAKLLYGHGGLVSGALDPGMWSGLYAVSHREYPLGLPAVEALDFHAMGGADAQAIHLQIVIVVGAFLASAWSFLRPGVHPALLTAALCLPVAAPSLHTQVLSGYADVPMACLWAMAALMLGLWLRHGRGDLLALSGVLAAGALSVKQEGIVLDAALVVVAAGLLLAEGRRALLGRLALTAGAVAATAVPWQLYVRARHFSDADIAPSAGRSVRQLGQLPEIGHQLGAQLVWVKWPAIVPLAAAVAVLLALRRRDRAASAYLLLMTAALAALAFVYLNARVYVPALLERSAERVVLAPVLLSAIALPMLLSRLLERPRSGC
jgi:Dolichyl-phosphate-mannose-protein mannosyltransferase